jgi:hypothetical protein
MSKIRVGIDINETLRAKFSQFHKYYIDEFGEDGVPENPYTFDYFNDYKFEDEIVIERELREPEDTPDINPVYYKQDENGDTLADAFLFKKSEKKIIPAKEVYNTFMYQDFLFEIHGLANLIYRNADVDVNRFVDKYKNEIDVVFLSVENKLSVAPTLFFLSKIIIKK